MPSELLHDHLILGKASHDCCEWLDTVCIENGASMERVQRSCAVMGGPASRNATLHPTCGIAD
eukprot:756235-Amphidinium_carterae.1